MLVNDLERSRVRYVAERNRLEIEEGASNELFDVFIKMYREMVSRKLQSGCFLKERLRTARSVMPWPDPAR